MYDAHADEIQSAAFAGAVIHVAAAAEVVQDPVEAGEGVIHVVDVAADDDERNVLIPVDTS